MSDVIYVGSAFVFIGYHDIAFTRDFKSNTVNFCFCYFFIFNF